LRPGHRRARKLAFFRGSTTASISANALECLRLRLWCRANASNLSRPVRKTLLAILRHLLRKLANPLRHLLQCNLISWSHTCVMLMQCSAQGAET